MLILATVLVHETSFVNQHFYSTLLGEGGVCKKSTLCTFVKMLDGPLIDNYFLDSRFSFV